MDPLPTDASIIAQSTCEPERFAEIFDRHVSAIHGYLARRAGGDAADGLVGEVFRVAFEVRSRYRSDRPSALPWLYGIAANVLRQDRRGRLRRQRLATKLVWSSSSLVIDDDAAESVHARDRLAQALVAVDALPRAERETVLLHVWEELTYEQIAEASNVPVGTVRSRLNRARTRIREHLDVAGQVGGEPVRPADRRWRP